MGVERSVTRWYVLRQVICNEIAQLEAKLLLISTDEVVGTDVSCPSTTETELQQQLAEAREKLRLLGPCPRPMMG